jgi:hypothetical protein
MAAVLLGGRLGGLAVVALLALLPGAAPAGAQLSLSRWTLDTGGGTVAGGAFTLTGTIGQPDAAVHAGGSFTLQGGFWFGGMSVSGVDDGPTAPAPDLPARLALAIAPNPVVRSATVQWELPRAGHVSVGVYDASGRQVAALADETYPAGRHELTWNTGDRPGGRLAAGVYFVRLEAGRQFISRKLLIVH